MKLKINIQAELRRLLTLTPGRLHRTNGVEARGEGLSVAPVDLSLLIEDQDYDSKVYPDFVYAQVIQLNDADLMLSETGKGAKMITQMIGNRVRQQPDGSFDTSNEAEFIKLDVPNLSTESRKFKPGSFLAKKMLVNPAVLQQVMLVSSRLVGLYPHEKNNKRRADEAPSLVALVPPSAMQLSMYPYNTRNLNLYRIQSQIWRTAESPMENDYRFGWADYYHRGGKYAEPDGPKDSMNNAGMWQDDNAPCVRWYLKSQMYTGKNKHGFAIKAKNRQTERYQHTGRGDFDSTDIFDLVARGIDYGAPGYTKIAGSVVRVSTDANKDTAPYNDLEPYTGIYTDRLTKSAIMRALRGFYLAAFSRTHSLINVGRSGTATIWDRDWDPEACIRLKGMIQNGAYNPQGANTSTSSRITTKWVTIEDWVIPGETWKITNDVQKSSGSGTGKTAGSAYVEVLSTPLAIFGNVGGSEDLPENISQSHRWAQNSTFNPPPSEADRARTIIGQMSGSESWQSRASGLSVSPMNLFSNPMGGSIECLAGGIELDSQCFVGPNAMSLVPDDTVREALCVHTYSGWPVVGHLAGVRGNFAAGLFEDDVEDSASDWQYGDAFFCFFFTF